MNKELQTVPVTNSIKFQKSKYVLRSVLLQQVKMRVSESTGESRIPREFQKNSGVICFRRQKNMLNSRQSEFRLVSTKTFVGKISGTR